MFSSDYLYREPISDNETEYPSPESLARKILIKGSKNSKTKRSSIIHYSVTETPSNNSSKSNQSDDSIEYIEEEIEIDSENEEETNEKEEGKIEFELRDSIGDALTTKMFMMPKKVCILKISN